MHRLQGVFDGLTNAAGFFPDTEDDKSCGYQKRGDKYDDEDGHILC